MAGLDIESNKAITNIRKFGNESVLWEMIDRYTGYVHDPDQVSLIALASHILITTLSMTMKSSCLNGLEKLISEPHQQRCYDLINEWMHSEDDDELYEIARDVEDHHHLVKRFDGLDVQDLLNSECFPCINECILRRYMTEISENVIKADDMVAAVEKRRTLKWYKRVRYYYDGLLQVAQMQQFYQANIGGFHIAEYTKLWKEYTGNYCKMDHFYRQFHAAFGKSLKESSTVLEDLYKNVADYVEKLYKNWYLSTLGNQWTTLVRDELSQSSRLLGITNQEDFYRAYVKPIVSAGSRAFVIISDALRYEVAVELTSKLLRETKGAAQISSMQSVFPSVTKFGMAALLPHRELQLTDDIKVLCDGEPTEGTTGRQKILNAVHDGNVAIAYKTLLGMKTAERRELVSNAQVVYIYHNAIDAVGDKAATEDQVFEACDQAVTELKKLVRLIANDMNGTNMYCATDDEEAIEVGLGKIKRILSENYVRPDQSEYVKSKIKENGQYTIIDKITVVFDDREDKYVARFTNLRMDPFEVPSDLVVHNEKLLVGGIWCIVKIDYVGLEKENEDDQESFEEDIFGNQKKKKKVKKKKSKYDSPFEISSLKPIQMPNLDLDEIKDARANFTKDEWITLLLRSAGYEPDDLTQKEKLHYLLRFVPFIQKNYNLVELGPRGTGKSHVYSELSPYSILMSSGTTTVSNMFYNMSSRRVGLARQFCWLCCRDVCFQYCL